MLRLATAEKGLLKGKFAGAADTKRKQKHKWNEIANDLNLINAKGDRNGNEVKKKFDNFMGGIRRKVRSRVQQKIEQVEDPIRKNMI